MEVIPAIDIKGGQCVRLVRGDFRRELVFSPDPAGVARRWHSLGAPRLHLVDLDGAVAGHLVNLSVIEEIRRAVTLPLQLGGGLREMATIEHILGLGIERVILSTIAVVQPELVAQACQRFPERIAVSIDARRGIVRIKGWRDRTGLRAVQLAERMAALGVRRFIYTDISRDGTLTHPNFTAIAEMVSGLPFPVIASGGISSVEDLKKLRELGVEGAIVGRALYSGALDLAQALELVRG